MYSFGRFFKPAWDRVKSVGQSLEDEISQRAGEEFHYRVRTKLLLNSEVQLTKPSARCNKESTLDFYERAN